MVRLGLIACVLALGAFFGIRWVVKLPSRYERKPRILSPWNALDHGIDPSVGDGGES